MRASQPDTTDRSFDVLFELEGHPLPTFVARLVNTPSRRGAAIVEAARAGPELVIVERHFVTGDSRTSLLRVTSKLENFRHPNVMTVHEILDTIGVISVVSQFIEGEILSSFEGTSKSSRRPIALPVRIRIVLDVLSRPSASMARVTESSSNVRPLTCSHCEAPSEVETRHHASLYLA